MSRRSAPIKVRDARVPDASRGLTGRDLGGSIRAIPVVLIILTGTLALMPGPAVSAMAPRPAIQAPDPRCALDTIDDGAADDLLARRYRFPPHRSVRLPWPLVWRADPLADRNWRFQYHSLTWLEPLMARWVQGGERVALDRALAVARAWLERNPRRHPPSTYSWEAHATALRASVLTCLAGLAPGRRWLIRGLRLHGRELADPRTYLGHGNHALNQAIGLLDVGCLLGFDRWRALAGRRIRELLPRSVDRQGVTDEQAIGYQHYVLIRYRLALERLGACGLTLPAAAGRIDRMPRLLAFATQPDGRYQMIGDTADERAVPVPGTIAEFAATAGASGPRPAQEIAVFDAGYVTGRTGWGEERPFGDEVAFLLRFGPARTLHGHEDGGSLTLYGYGSRLLLDPGFGAYEFDAWRTYFQSRAAHDVVTVDGTRSDASRPTRLLRARTSESGFEALLEVRAYRGITQLRRVVFSRQLGYLIVEDRLRSRPRRTFRQLWHLREDARPIINGPTVRTRRPRGNVLIRQLIAPRLTRLVSGRRKPIQGWVSYRYDGRQAAPVVEAFQWGRRVRYLTLIVPAAAADVSVQVTEQHLTDDGYSLVVEVDGRRERVTADSDGAVIEPQP